MVETKDETPTYPPVVQQAWNNMKKFENCIVFTRVGSFYEVCSYHIMPARKILMFVQLYLDQADRYGPLLNLKVAKKKTTAGPVSMVCPLRLKRSRS